ncbi:SUKH-4 family immunity protein [Streptomyces sp. MUM 203J]|uniref:SUKH-4 family immunity protein n=1 Tax=Streptomyces sp. MUM 203J TaxID=2791990 RepID=UPI001F04173E|nr:SUKH-4 family immunity protein [Streptomyces sp. MUM 203J]MCH0538320.1 SUKH-4 family immunity protein [Streptomyces sp. MUM 203J]
MVTFAQAQERAEEWINGDVPAYQHREVRVREFGLGFVVWAEDRPEGPVSDGGRQRLVIARDSGEVTLWPGLPVGEVIRRYEEEYGSAVTEDPADAGAARPPERIDLNQTSFLLTPPEWLQDAADQMGIPDRRSGEPEPARPTASGGAAAEPMASDAAGAGASPGPEQELAPEPRPEFTPAPGQVESAADVPVPAPAPDDEDGAVREEPPAAPAVAVADTAGPGADSGAVSPWSDANAQAPADVEDDGSVPLPATVFAPALAGSDEDDTPPPSVPADAPTALMKGGSQLPPTAVTPAMDVEEAVRTANATPPPGATPPPASGPGAPGAPAGGYVPTQLVAALGPDGPKPPGTPAPGTPAAGSRAPGTPVPGTPAPPGPPGPPPPPGPTPPPGSTPPPGAGVHQAATMLAQPPAGGPPAPPGPAPAAPGAVPPPGAPAYGYPQQPGGLPTVGPGYQVVVRYRAPDGSEAQIIRRSAPGVPHPEWQILHELRAMNVPPQQVLELHTELASCELPGGYCARMIRETWPQARITSIAPYGRDHASRQQGMQQLIAHQGELHQVADGPARPAPVRAPLPPVQPAPPLPPEGVAQELAVAFGPHAICRFDQRAVSRQGVPDLVARTLVWSGLPADFGPFFWAQPAQPVVPTLAELAAQRQVQPASDAGSYLVVGSDFGRAICVQYGTAHIVAVPVEAGPGGQPVAPQFVNTGLPEFTRCLALLGRMWHFRYGLTPEQAGRWTVDFQAQLAMLDPAALSSPESWWSVLLEQMWDGLL